MRGEPNQQDLRGAPDVRFPAGSPCMHVCMLERESVHARSPAPAAPCLPFILWHDCVQVGVKGEGRCEG
eukprot:58902-Chlamydomonas_euryale.AAC.1